MNHALLPHRHIDSGRVQPGRDLRRPARGTATTGIGHYQPRTADDFRARAELWNREGEGERAIADFSAAIRLAPNRSILYLERGLALTAQGENEKSLVDADQAIRLGKISTGLSVTRALWTASRQYAKAKEDLSTAMRLSGKQNFVASGNMAWLLATCPAEGIRDGRRAVELARRTCEFTGWKSPSAIDTLAAAYAEAGDFTAAIAAEEKAIEMAPDEQNFKDRAALYENRKPYREP